MDKPRVTLNTYKTALQPESSRKCLTPKDDMIYDIIANMTVYTRLAQAQTNKTAVSKGKVGRKPSY